MPTDRPFQTCERCGMRTRSVTRLCSDHRPKKTAKRPEHPCTGCGQRTTAKGQVCRICREEGRCYGHRTSVSRLRDPAANLDLVPGEWVPNGAGTMRFEPAERRECRDCGVDITFAESPRAARCPDCTETPGPQRHELITDELATAFEEAS